MDNVNKLKDKVDTAIRNDPEFAKAWVDAESALRADGVDVTNTTFENLVPLLAGKNEEFAGLSEILNLCVKQDAENAKAPVQRAKSPEDLVGPGAPLLVTGSGPKATQFAKELAWKRGIDPEFVEADLFSDDAPAVEAVFRTTALGAFVVIEGLESCTEAVRKTALDLSKDKDRTVVVAVRGRDVPVDLPPGEFAHWAKFP